MTEIGVHLLNEYYTVEMGYAQTCSPPGIYNLVGEQNIKARWHLSISLYKHILVSHANYGI